MRENAGFHFVEVDLLNLGSHPVSLQAVGTPPHCLIIYKLLTQLETHCICTDHCSVYVMAWSVNCFDNRVSLRHEVFRDSDNMWRGVWKGGHSSCTGQLSQHFKGMN